MESGMSNLKIGEPFARRTLAYTSILGITQLHLRNPYVIAFWSAAFPGSGHMLLSMYARGYVLFIWEVFVNYKARINLLILFSFIGDFEQAKQVVDIRWMPLYVPTYIFAIWDSYRIAINLNNAYKLASWEDAAIKPLKIGALELNYLDKRNPWLSAIWSLLMPGAGQWYIHRLVMAFFIVVWWIIICYMSKLLPSLHYTFLGDFQQAKSVLDMHWFLNFPSIYFFAMYDAYVNTVENNKLFDWEQSKYLKSEYQSPEFKMPIKNRAREDSMYIISTFEHSVYLELAITAIQALGIKKEKILAVPLDKRSEQGKILDSMHGSDGLSLFDLPAILAVLGGIFGGIYGFVLKWGPLLWGLICIIAGAVLGFAVKYVIVRKYSSVRQLGQKGTEVVLMIECSDSQLEMVKDILWSRHALGVRKLDLYNNELKLG